MSEHTRADEEIVERYHEAFSDILSLFVFMAGWDFPLVDEALDLLAENMDKFPTGAALVERIEQRKGETR